MSKQWICAICGETAISKCPAQRNIFSGGFEGQILASLITAAVIRGGITSEVVFNVTTSTDDKNEDQLKADALKTLVEHNERLAKTYCDHIWVRNSETERDCTLGCHNHYNLTDVALLREQTEKPEKPELIDIVSDLKQVLKNQVEFTRKVANINAGKYDKEIESHFNMLKDVIHTACAGVSHGRRPTPLFKVLLREDYGDVYFDDEATLNHFLLMNPTVQNYWVYKYDWTQGGYVHYNHEVTRICGHCGKNITELFWVQTAEGSLHEKCNRQIKESMKAKRRRVRLKFEDISERVADKLSYCWESFGPDYDYDKRKQDRYTQNLRELLRSEAAYAVELLDYHYCRPETYKDGDGKIHRFNGMNHLTFVGMKPDVDKVIEQLKEISK